MKLSISTLCIAIAVLVSHSIHAQWLTLRPGLELGTFQIRDSAEVSILRINPKQYELVLLTRSEQISAKNKTAKQWSTEHNLIAAINAGMFAQDYSTHIGYMRSKDHVNSSHINKYQSLAAFHPRTPDMPLFQIYDLDNKDVSIDHIKKNYHSLVQNLRLIKKTGENRWSQQTKRWSEAALGEDKAGNILFIFMRTPLSMHDFNNELLALDLQIVAAQHLEGGPEAQLYIKVEHFEAEMFGSYETAFNENNDKHIAWPVPNIIGIRAKH